MAVPRPTGVAALVRLRLSGVAFLIVIALLVALTVAATPLSLYVLPG
jgi:hypothetical protein